MRTPRPGSLTNHDSLRSRHGAFSGGVDELADGVNALVVGFDDVAVDIFLSIGLVVEVKVVAEQDHDRHGGHACVVAIVP